MNFIEKVKEHKGKIIKIGIGVGVAVVAGLAAKAFMTKPDTDEEGIDDVEFLQLEEENETEAESETV